jgi:hypothetical protein
MVSLDDRGSVPTRARSRRLSLLAPALLLLLAGKGEDGCGCDPGGETSPGELTITVDADATLAAN